jgi:DNA transformation protein
MPGNQPEFVQHCLDLLASVGPCVAKRMFGGWGISTGGLTLAIIADLGDGERLWLKADATTLPTFEAAGCPPFVYTAKGKPVTLNYRAAPEDAMESPALMRHWATLALDAAVRAHAAKPARTTASKAAKAPKEPKVPRKAAANEVPKKPLKPSIKTLQNR